MPSQEAATVLKRPSISSRHSSSTSNLGRSPGDTLSSSAQKLKPQRHVLSHAHSRLGARVPSFVKSTSKLTKLTPAHGGDETPTSPRPSSIKRNSTTASLAQTHSHSALRKNHSETSLKKNRSSGQLTTLSKLTKAHSHKNVHKLGKGDGKAKRNSSHLKLQEAEHEHATVRFDLGDEEGQDDGWTEGSASQSPTTTRDNTRPNSAIIEQASRPTSAPAEIETSPSNERYPPVASPVVQPERSSSPESPPPAVPQSIPQSTSNKLHALRHPDADRITSRLLNRNVSFTALPKVSEVSAPAMVIGDGHKAKMSIRSQSSTLNETTGSELVSRFVNGASTSATPRETGFLPAHYENPEDEDHAGMFRNMSTPNITRAQSRANVKGAAATTSLVMPASRTQQKMWLERASSTIEPQQVRPMRITRLGSGFPFHAVGGEGGIRPTMRSQFEQTDVEYKRIRMYQNPLADAITRLQKSGALPKTKVPLKPAGKSALHGSDVKQGAPQDSKAPKPANSNAPPKRAKVSFQGITRNGPDSRRSSNGDDDERIRYKDEAREICRRLWERQEGVGEE